MSNNTDTSGFPYGTISDHVVDIAGIGAVAVMAINGVAGYEPFAVVASIALGKRYYDAKLS